MRGLTSNTMPSVGKRFRCLMSYNHLIDGTYAWFPKNIGKVKSITPSAKYKNLFTLKTRWREYFFYLAKD